MYKLEHSDDYFDIEFNDDTDVRSERENNADELGYDITKLQSREVSKKGADFAKSLYSKLPPSFKSKFREIYNREKADLAELGYNVDEQDVQDYIYDQTGFIFKNWLMSNHPDLADQYDPKWYDSLLKKIPDSVIKILSHISKLHNYIDNSYDESY